MYTAVDIFKLNMTHEFTQTDQGQYIEFQILPVEHVYNEFFTSDKNLIYSVFQSRVLILGEMLTADTMTMCHSNPLILSSLIKTRNQYEMKKMKMMIALLLWRCPWCNGHRHRKWTRQLEFKSWTRLIAFHIALISLGKVWIQLFSLQLWVNSRTDWVLLPGWGN